MLIYKITNIIDGKSYIGQTVNFKQRMYQHFNRPTREVKSYLKRAILKNGKDSFSVEIIGYAESREELNKLEAEFIIKHNTLAPNGYNVATGGTGGYERTLKTRESLSNAIKGRVMGPDHGRKVSEGKLKANFKHTEETKQKIKEAIKDAVIKKQKRIVAINSKTLESFYYDSIKQAAEALNTRPGSISRVLTGGRFQHKNFKFEYLKENKDA